MMREWATIPRRVSIATIAICCAILGIGALILIQLYRTHEIRELELLVAQDLLIESSRITFDGTNIDLSKGDGRGIYDLDNVNWVWQLTKEREGDAPEILVQSPSLGPLTATSAVLDVPESGKGNFMSPNGGLVLGLSAAFPGAAPEDRLIFRIAGPMRYVSEGIRSATRLIALVFFGIALTVSISVYFTVNRGLRPLGRLSASVKAMRQDDQIIDKRNWPPDLAPVVEELRELHRRNNMNLEKTRRKNAELAHGLKTPLAALRRVAEGMGDNRRDQIVDLIDRMTRVIKRNLSRARTERPYGKSAPVRTSAEDVLFALGVIFRDRMPEVEIAIDTRVVFSGEVADIQEIFGNLLENACFWAKSRVRISVTTNGRDLITLYIEDDGPGMGQSQKIPDTTTDDDDDEHGLGLLIVQDIAELYGGSVDIGTSTLGGAKVSVSLPGRIETPK